MMISPKGFYEETLKGKTVEEHLKKIRSLKREINRLKNIAEHPYYERKIDPSEEVRISVFRMYLDEAKKALGKKYIPTKAEKSAKEFEKNIPYIEKIVFSIGGFFSGFETRTITLRNDKFCSFVKHTDISMPSNITDDNIKKVEKKDFLEEFKNLHIGEWRKNYTAERFGIKIYDGTQWELEIYFSNGKRPKKFCGNNAYPYNFDSFKWLMEMDF